MPLYQRNILTRSLERLL